MSRPLGPGSGRAYAEVIGDPIAHSKSPLIHNFWLEKLGIDAEYRACHVKPDELEDYFAQRRGDAEWRGCNVTMPHKQSVMPFMDSIDPLANQVGAVNTIVPNADGGLTGYNTDVAGFLEPLWPLLKEQGIETIRIAGTGGAARAALSAALEINQEGTVNIVLGGRDETKAATLLKELAYLANARPVNLDAILPQVSGSRPELFANTTPLGMFGNPQLNTDLSRLPDGSIVYDIVTHPVETELLKDARSRGFKTIDGLSMLVGQAAVAFEKFFGKSAPREHDAELRAMLTA